MDIAVRYANQVIGYFQTIKISDIIDMLIIAFVFYRLFLLIRKTQAGRVLRGIVLLLLAWAVSYEFNLHVLSFILRSAVEIGLLALIVLFQPEIRRFLEQFGSNRFRFFFGVRPKSFQLEETIQETVEAFRSMSKDRIGALVVFERSNILDNYVKSGTSLDAEVSAELLKNIFWPKTPLHDGAVVVRNGRIVSAGCVLPLTDNQNVSRDLGTRHRAAIGISEHSDAVAAIVSEETGAISVSVDGMLKRHLSLDTLEQLLHNELIPEREKNRGAFSGPFRHRKEEKDRVE